MCPTNDVIEDTEHFLLLCPSVVVQRRDLLAGMVESKSEPNPNQSESNLNQNDALTQFLLYGDQDLSYDLNKNILQCLYGLFTKLVASTKIF